jgi:hypothetical protein
MRHERTLSVTATGLDQSPLLRMTSLITGRGSAKSCSTVDRRERTGGPAETPDYDKTFPMMTAAARSRSSIAWLINAQCKRWVGVAEPASYRSCVYPCADQLCSREVPEIVKSDCRRPDGITNANEE